MGATSFVRRYTALLCGVVVAACPLGGLAQIASAPVTSPDDEITTVAPLEVNALAPVPDVGAGATYFMPKELAEVAHQAREDGIDARDAAVQCHGSDVNAFMKPHHIEPDDFDAEALADTEGKTQFAMQKAAEAAEAATQAALDARTALATGEGHQQTVNDTELARQTAVKAYQDAQSATTEAHLRLADLLDLASDHVGGDIMALQTLELGLYVEGCGYMAPGAPVMYSPPTCFNGPKENMGQFKLQVDERSAQRSQHGGAQVAYVPDEFKDLRLAEIVARERDEGGVTVMHISGRIVNPRKSAIDIPPLWGSAMDKFGTALESKQAEPPAHLAKIPAGGSLPFTFALKPMPAKTVRASVTFAPLHRASMELPIGVACGV